MLDEVPGIDLEVVDEVSETPFLNTCFKGNLALVRKLHLLGCHVHHHDTNRDRETALHWAPSKNYHNDVAEYLLVQCKCDPNIAEIDGTLPLDLTC